MSFCPSCGQASLAEHSGACPACVRASRASQGEQAQLFSPLAPQLGGQTTFSAAAAVEQRPMTSDEQRADRFARIATTHGLGSC